MKKLTFIAAMILVIFSFFAINALVVFKILESHREIKYEKEQVIILKSKLNN
jgi:hypothetical protein